MQLNKVSINENTVQKLYFSIVNDKIVVFEYSPSGLKIQPGNST